MDKPRGEAETLTTARGLTPAGARGDRHSSRERDPADRGEPTTQQTPAERGGRHLPEARRSPSVPVAEAGGGEGRRVRGQCPSAAPRLLRSKVPAPPRSVPSPQRSLCPHRRRARPRGAAAPAPRPQGSGSGGFRGCRVGAARLLGRPGGHVPPTGRRRPRPSAERPGGAWPPVHPQAGHCGHPTRGAAMSPSLSRRRQDGPGLKCDSGTSRTKHYLG